MSDVTEWMTDIAEVAERLGGGHDRATSLTDAERALMVRPKAEFGA